MRPTPQFTTTDTTEPHARRRRELIKRYPQIRSLFGHDRRTAWITFAVVAAQLSLAAFAGAWSGSLWLLLPAAWLIGAPLTHWLSTAIHETAHRLAFRTQRANTLLALVANLPMVVPFAISFHRYHGDHHRLLGVVGEDSDLPLQAEVLHIRNSAIRKAIWLLLHPFVYMARGAVFARRPTLGEIGNALLLLAVDLAIYHFLGGAALAWLALSFFFGHGLHPVAAHFIHEHYTFAEGQETFSYYGPLNLITFNVGYHNEHHDFMAIPGWRLPELTRLVPDYRALVSHTSWTRILTRFITDPHMGYASRIVRAQRSPR